MESNEFLTKKNIQNKLQNIQVLDEFENDIVPIS